ncbi:caveolin-3-like [Parasteatoda tepidariorum]|uniref:caveolin-3-like n=1 Tax=Parasteatoda tepidariorum TaxID=114398 RepID=UPI00077F8549|nr:caveolin-3-like [Parasteatoda tepidariorum]
MDGVNRDPNSLSEYLQQLRDDLRMVDVPIKQLKRMESPPPTPIPSGPYLTTVEFDDVIAEPEGTYSPSCVWRNAKYIFSCSKNCCYRTLSLVCALPIALIVGCSFACITFQHVWCIAPALRQFNINCHAVRMFLRTALDACLGPCCTTLGLVLSKIRISQHTDNTRHV